MTVNIRIEPPSEDYHDLALILGEALKAVNPVESVKNAINVEDDTITIGGKRFPRLPVHVVGFGKASAYMAKGVEETLNDLVKGGVVIVPRGSPKPKLRDVKVLEAHHPIPGYDNVKASQQLLEYAETVEPNSITVVLVSGGGSALFEIPANDITIEDIATVTRELLRRGASIEELNAVRKHISAVKGGQLLRYIRSEHVATLVISDVIGDRLDTIASGPTVPDETSFNDAYLVLRKYNLWDNVPKRVRKWILKGLRGEVPETPKPGDPIFQRNHVVIVANNMKALKAADKAAERLGYNTLILTDRLRGEAREVAKAIASIVESAYYNHTPVKPPAAIIAGGETIVTVRGNGIGGRNQELCLALTIETDSKVAYRAACMGTDGVDGISPAAGAFTSNKVREEAAKMKLNPVEYLERNDSYTFFKKLGKTIETGYTGTNVNDILVVLVTHP